MNHQQQQIADAIQRTLHSLMEDDCHPDYERVYQGDETALYEQMKDFDRIRAALGHKQDCRVSEEYVSSEFDRERGPIPDHMLDQPNEEEFTKWALSNYWYSEMLDTYIDRTAFCDLLYSTINHAVIWIEREFGQKIEADPVGIIQALEALCEHQHFKQVIAPIMDKKLNTQPPARLI